MDQELIEQSEPNSGRAAAVLMVLFGLVLVATMWRIGHTSDESIYMLTGRQLLMEPEQGLAANWENPKLLFQGPVALIFGQTFLHSAPLEEMTRARQERSVLFLGRLGLLPFGLLAALGVYLWARKAFGAAGGLLSLGFFCLDPLMQGYGSLMTVDMAYSALLLWVGYFLWRYSESLSKLDLGMTGVFLGLGFGTKYIAALMAPIVALIVVICAWRGAASKGGRSSRLAGLRGATAAWVLLVACTVLALHACYGFGGGFAPGDPGIYQSPLLGSLMDMPLVSSFLQLLPTPFLYGVDQQFDRGHGERIMFLNGHFAGSHYGYYLWTILYKTSEVALAALAFLMVRRGPSWIRAAVGRAGRRAGESAGLRSESRAAWIVLSMALVPLAYLSFFTSYQVGVRFALFFYPLLYVLLGALARDKWLGPQLAAHPKLWALCFAIPLAYGPISTFPNSIAYFNSLGGGQARAFEHFIDSNSDWGQMRDDGLRILHDTEDEDFQIYYARGAARFGRVALYVRYMARYEADYPESGDIWIHHFEPERHLDAAWWLYDIQPEAFEAAVERSGDERLRRDLVLAYLGAGELEPAARHLALLKRELAEPLEKLLELSRRRAQGEMNELELSGFAMLWALRGRPDISIEWLEAEGAPDNVLSRRALVNAYFQVNRVADAVRVLEGEGVIAEDPPMATSLSRMYRYQQRHGKALEILLEWEQECRASNPVDFEKALSAAQFRVDYIPKWGWGANADSGFGDEALFSD